MRVGISKEIQIVLLSLANRPNLGPILVLSNGCWKQFYQGTKRNGGPSSVVGKATAYGLDGPGIESRWERDFPHLFRPALRPTQPTVQRVPGLSRGKDAAGA